MSNRQLGFMMGFLISIPVLANVATPLYLFGITKPYAAALAHSLKLEVIFGAGAPAVGMVLLTIFGFFLCGMLGYWIGLKSENGGEGSGKNTDAGYAEWERTQKDTRKQIEVGMKKKF